MKTSLSCFILGAFMLGSLLAGCTWSPARATTAVSPRAVASRRHEQLIAALRSTAPHPEALDLSRRGDAFQNA